MEILWKKDTARNIELILNFNSMNVIQNELYKSLIAITTVHKEHPKHSNFKKSFAAETTVSLKGYVLFNLSECVNKNETKNKRELVWNRLAVRIRHWWIDPNGRGYHGWAGRMMDKALRMGEISCG